MKKTLFAKLITVLIAVCAVAFVVTACNFGSSEEESSFINNSCYEQSESGSLENSSIEENSSEDSSSENSSREDSSSEDSSTAEDGEEQEENGLRFNNIALEGNSGYVVVSNATEKFSFADEVAVTGKTKFVVSLDEFGINTSLTKVVPLSIGNNVVYVFEMIDDKVQNVFTITIRRRPTYSVTFNTNGGSSVQSQQVEEGFTASIPEEIPTKNGYEFASWAFDFASPIMQKTSISANWALVTYSITYDFAGGSYDGELPSEYTIESDFSLPTPSQNDYGFLGWYERETKITTLKGYYGNKTLTAKWESIYNYSNGQITGLKSKYSNLSQIVIPEEINGQPITSIGSSAFEGCNRLTSVVIPDSVTSIGERAFWACSSLTNIKVDENNANYKSIDGNLYSKDGKTLIQYAIGKTATTFEIPDSVTTIGDYAFYSCSSLTSVVIPDSITSIGDYAFSNCSSLTSIEIPDSVTSIGEWAFGGCDSLEYNVKDNLNYLGNETNPYLYLSGVTSQDITSANIDNSCKFIGDDAFEDCSSLTSVVISDSVTSIGNSAFYYCESLTSIEIPEGVTSIGNYAFSDCSSLTSIVIPDSVTSIGYQAFYNCDSLTSVVIPDSITSIGRSAFSDCSSLTSIVIPDSVTSIGGSAFSDCSSLTSIVIPDSVTSIGGSAFSNCSSLTSIEIPDSVTSIGNFAFSGCSSLTSIEIPDSVTSIGSDVFSHCSSLTSIVIPDSITSIGDWAFFYCYSLTSIKYRGTEAEWNAIPKDSYWDSNTGNYTITYNYIGE